LGGIDDEKSEKKAEGASPMKIEPGSKRHKTDHPSSMPPLDGATPAATPATPATSSDNGASSYATPSGPASPSSPFAATEPMSPVNPSTHGGGTSVAPIAPPGSTSTATISTYDASGHGHAAPVSLPSIDGPSGGGHGYDPVDTSADGATQSQVPILPLETKASLSTGVTSMDEKRDDAWGGAGGDPFGGSSVIGGDGVFSDSSRGNVGRHDLEFRPHTVMVELIITFLVRLGLMTCEQVDTKFLSDRCLVLLKNAMKIWKG
jgi:hypothetical protein